MKLSPKRIIAATATAVSLILLIFLVVYLRNVAAYKQAVRETTVDEINISDVSDGIYIGEYDVNFIYAKVEVTVQDGKITNIELLEHKNERGKPAEAILGKMIDAQEINVDAISGATNSSTVIKKATEIALKKGM